MSKTTRFVMWSLIVLAIIVRIPFLRYQNQTAVEWADGAAYAVIGKNIISGNGIRDWYGPHTLWPPFYPALLGVVSLAIPDLEMAGRVVSLITGTLAVGFLYLIAHTLFSKETALYTAVLLATHPEISRASLTVMSESTYLCLLLAGIWLTVGILQKVRLYLCILVGLIFGCAYLTRPEAIGFLVLIPLLIICAHFRSGGQRQKVFIGVVALFAGFIVLAGPYVLFLRVHTGQWQISGKTLHNLAITDPRLGHSLEEKFHGLSPDGTHIGVTRVTVSEVVQYWREHPRVFVKRYTRLLLDQYHEVLPGACHPLLLALAGIGLYHGQWQRSSSGKLLLLVALFPFFIYPLSHVEQRYMIPLLPFVLIWAGLGVAVVVEGLQRARTPRVLFHRSIPVRALAHTAVVAVLLLPYFGFLIRPYDMGAEQKVVGQWMRQHIGTDAKIMERTHVVAFYADGIPFDLPYASLQQVLKYGARIGAEYLVVSEDRRHHPDLLALIDGTKVAPELCLVHVFDESAHFQIRKKIALYRVHAAKDKVGTNEDGGGETTTGCKMAAHLSSNIGT
jgi:Dolichyl-phosphate-mannose-protein mannosyltransferase